MTQTAKAGRGGNTAPALVQTIKAILPADAVTIPADARGAFHLPPADHSDLQPDA